MLDILARHSEVVDDLVDAIALGVPDANHVTIGILAIVAKEQRCAIPDRTKGCSAGC